MTKSLGIQTAVVPHHARVLAGRTRIVLHCVNQVVGFSGIFDEEDRVILSQQVLDSCFGAEPDGEITRITFGAGDPRRANNSL
jgi:hypothetical protein